LCEIERLLDVGNGERRDGVHLLDHADGDWCSTRASSRVNCLVRKPESLIFVEPPA
jgi:hypothetical protein